MDFKIRTLVVGQPGTGKTTFIGSCPKVYYIGVGFGEYDAIQFNKSIAKNIVKKREVVVDGEAGLKEVFGDIDKGVSNGKIHEYVKEAKEMYSKGEVETLAIDTLTILQEDLWQYVCKHCKKVTYKGEDDTRGMYGDLGTKTMQLIKYHIGSFPGNLIVTVHEKLETDEAMEKKLDKDATVTPSLIGGSRDKIEALFSIVMYLSKLESGGKYQYWARLNKGNSRNGKSRLPLPDKIKDISYQTIMEEIKKCTAQ